MVKEKQITTLSHPRLEGKYPYEIPSVYSLHAIHNQTIMSQKAWANNGSPSQNLVVACLTTIPLSPHTAQLCLGEYACPFNVLLDKSLGRQTQICVRFTRCTTRCPESSIPRNSPKSQHDLFHHDARRDQFPRHSLSGIKSYIRHTKALGQRRCSDHISFLPKSFHQHAASSNSPRFLRLITGN